VLDCGVGAKQNVPMRAGRKKVKKCGGKNKNIFQSFVKEITCQIDY
jgi:hypothetical protein